STPTRPMDSSSPARPATASTPASPPCSSWSGSTGSPSTNEPFAALDAQTREILQEEMLRILEQTRKTIVFVTHSIDEALLLGDRVIVLTARPARVKRIIPIPFPRPRNLAAIRADPGFGGLRARVWDLLREELR